MALNESAALLLDLNKTTTKRMIFVCLLIMLAHLEVNSVFSYIRL